MEVLEAKSSVRYLLYSTTGPSKHILLYNLQSVSLRIVILSHNFKFQLPPLHSYQYSSWNILCNNRTDVSFVRNSSPCQVCILCHIDIKYRGYNKYRLRYTFYILSFTGRCSFYCDMFRLSQNIFRQYKYDFMKVIIPITDPLFLALINFSHIWFWL
jgi:hypothetical protein